MVALALIAEPFDLSDQPGSLCQLTQRNQLRVSGYKSPPVVVSQVIAVQPKSSNMNQFIVINQTLLGASFFEKPPCMLKLYHLQISL